MPSARPSGGLSLQQQRQRAIQLAVRQQLGGDYTRAWTDNGLTIDMQIARSRIQAA